ncbi:MAG: hypothetical protein BJ554DRAFT_7401 [Olpidium bornovanus]|uniref:CPL domain-containing protein n=1 Tax=Olpidium bornovanus TaxID=278681 RepID=A0A8H8DJA0_9FUNG|nr:MAG: hypothetical protein BJ554DRAFT_7401 [Olpidium bornovanus]
MEPTLGAICRDNYGRKVVGTLLVGRSRRYLDQSWFDFLNSLDAIRARTSKKEPELRRQELLAALSPALVSLVAEKFDVLAWEPFAEQIVQDTLVHAKDGARSVCNVFFLWPAGDRTPIHDSMLKLLAEAVDDEKNPMLNSVSSKVYEAAVKYERKQLNQSQFFVAWTWFFASSLRYVQAPPRG